MSNLNNVLAEVQAKRAELTEQVKAVLASGIQDFMKEHPEVKALYWTQYTPYFADGDECVFNVHGFYASTKTADASRENVWDGESFEELYSYRNAKTPEGFSDATWKALIEFTSLLSSASDDLKAAFGDHVQVIVTQEGVEVEEYEHD